jgi:CYTH domain-containing protein
MENGKNEEIERKFLIEEANLPDLSRQVYMDIVQGYPNTVENSSLVYRLRQVLHMSPTNSFLGEQYFQTIKGHGFKKRPEFETELLIKQFNELWPLCETIVLNKKRYVLPLPEYAGIKMHLDIYKNCLKGLYTVEVEFKTEEDCDAFIPPTWFGMELSEDSRFTNVQLAMKGLDPIIGHGFTWKCVDCGTEFLEKNPHLCINGDQNAKPNFVFSPSKYGRNKYYEPWERK